jgi:outer membrane protein
MKRLVSKLVTAGMAVVLSTVTPISLLAQEYTLDDLFRIALTRSEKLKVAEENLTIAELDTDKARSFLYPRVTATGGYTQYSQRKITATGGIIQPENNSSWGIRVDETLSLSGRELTALGIAKLNVAQTKYDLSTIREDYLLRFVASAYYNVLLAKKSLDIAESNVERLTKYRDAAEKRLKVGEVTKTVLLRAEGELSGAKSDRLQAQNTLELANSVLASNVGIKGVFALVETPALTGDIPLLGSFQEEAFDQRADLKSAELQKQIATDQTKYTEGAFWPTITVTAASAGADQYPPSSTFNRDTFYAGVAFSLPLFEGGFRKADVAESKARERQAALLYEDAKKGVDIAVRTAYLDLMTQKGILEFLNDQLTFARDNYRAVTRQFEFGLSTSLDIMDANTLLVTAERKVVSALYDYQLALLTMKRATGTLLKTVAQK